MGSGDQSETGAIDLPNPLVVTPQTIFLEARGLLVKPGFVRLLESTFSLCQCLGLACGLERFKLLSRYDDGVDSSTLLHKNRFRFCLGADGTESVFGLRGSYLHGFSGQWWFSHFSHQASAPQSVA